MSVQIDYKSYIRDHFFIKNKHGILIPFDFNDVQDWYYAQLIAEHPDMQGLRENVLKGRQFGFSSIITAIFAVDFILSDEGEIPIIDSDVYSFKDEETQAHINRFNLFINSALIKGQGGNENDMHNQDAITKLRKAFLRVDNGGEIVSRRKGAQYHAQTASAKVSGRGGTKQNIHWSEVAFYPNTEIMNAKKLVTGAEEQVPEGYGKIFRETTGNMMGDFFAEEYYGAKEAVDSRLAEFSSRFVAWYLHKAYSVDAPASWELPEYYQDILHKNLATRDQCFWHYRKTKGLTDKVKLREYPTYDYEAFLRSGTAFFDSDALIFHRSRIRKPISEVMYVQAL